MEKCTRTESYDTAFPMFTDSVVLTRMKPARLAMCHSLVMSYGLDNEMSIFVSPALVLERDNSR